MNDFKHKIHRYFSQTKGFTLIELLVALTIASMVITISGIGLVAILNANAKSDEETDRRIALNNALGFMADEVRMAQSLAANATTATYTVASGASNAQPILAVTVPGVTNQIVYYIADPPSGSVWSGPKVIYRWGPSLNLDGTYSSGASTNELLIDSIDGSTSSPSCPSSTPNSNPSSSATGFYACVNSSGKLANIYLIGKLTTTSKTYKINTTVATRSINTP